MGWLELKTFADWLQKIPDDHPYWAWSEEAFFFFDSPVPSPAWADTLIGYAKDQNFWSALPVAVRRRMARAMEWPEKPPSSLATGKTRVEVGSGAQRP